MSGLRVSDDVAPDGDLDAISATAQAYYDSDEAFNFYSQVWGGEHIHVGLYDDLDQGPNKGLEGVTRILAASLLNTERLFEKAGGLLKSGTKCMDMGSAYGGTARYCAKTFGCQVTCIDISVKENAVNRAKNEEQGLSHLVLIPGDKSFLATGEPDASHEVVVSQDSLLHAGSERRAAVGEAARVLKPGGLLIFTDIMQADDADPSTLAAVYRRIHLENMGSPGAYKQWAADHGLELVSFEDRTGCLTLHYGSVREVLLAKKGTLNGVSDAFVDNMVSGLDAWVEAAGKKSLRWGYMVFRKQV